MEGSPTVPNPVVLSRTSVDDIVRLNTAARDVARDRTSMAEAAQAMSELLFRELQTDGAKPAAALARIYLTSRYGTLPTDLQAVARSHTGTPLPASAPCLTLLGTAGSRPEWCDPARSRAHRAIPLSSTSGVATEAPMIAGLMSQLGVSIDEIVELAQEDALGMHHRDYGIFFVEDARSSPLIPTKDFVHDEGVRSVVGCGGALPSGEIFAFILFAKVTIDDGVASLFRTLAYGIKAALIPYTYNVFGNPG